MPAGEFNLPYVATTNAPYWKYHGANPPDVAHPDGTIPAGSEVMFMRPADPTASFQGAHLQGAGRVNVRPQDFRAKNSAMQNP
jgi:hypothetical protein